VPGADSNFGNARGGGVQIIRPDQVKSGQLMNGWVGPRPK
jgi:hypothetical protein